VGEKISIKIDAALVERMRTKAIADGLPGAGTIPDELLLAALIRAELGEEPPTEEPPPIDVTPTGDTLWVRAEHGANLRGRPVTGDILRVLPDREKLARVDSKENWLLVRTTDNLLGWISATFVTEVNPFPPIPPKGNVRGIHGAAGMVAPPRHLWETWIQELEETGVAWYKQLDGGDPNDVGSNSTFSWARRLKRNGIEPIIRYYQGQMFPGRLHNQAFQKMERYAAEGIVWCEIGNEPNLDTVEWHSRYHGRVSWQNPYFPRIIVENWIKDAEKAADAGARPGFYALSPTDWGAGRPHPRLSSVMFYRRMFEYVAMIPDLEQRFRRLFEPEKAWLAVHASTYEWPVDLNPFPLNQPPYDMCLRGYEVPLRYLRELVLGDVAVTVMSTEGGVFAKDSPSMVGHTRLTSHAEHAQRTIEMFDWIQENSLLQAMCPWLVCNVFDAIGHQDPAWVHDGWYDGRPPNLRPKPVVQAMKDSKPVA